MSEDQQPQSTPPPAQGTAGGAKAPCSEAGGTVLSADLLAACIHCGLCLPACPTYLATGRETESPRGRIYLMNLWQKGEQPLDGRVAEHLESCLGCLGCQTACPSGVAYGELLDQARPHLAEHRDRRLRKLMRFVFRQILPDYPRLRGLGKMLRLWQSAGGRKILSSLPIFRKLIARLDRWQSFLPAVPEFASLPRMSWGGGEKLGQVQLFSGCVMDIFYNRVNLACIKLLTRQRRVVQVSEQTCCGALAFHAGEVDIARELARRNIELYERVEGPVVVTAAGCGAMLKHYDSLLADDADWSRRAREFSERVADITEALAEGEFVVPSKTLKRKVAYHAACHLYHAQNVREAPLALLKRIDGITLIPLPEAEHCCGSAGIYNLTHTALSLDVLERKMEMLEETGADTVVTTNPGCQLQLQAGVRERELSVEVSHVAELLAEAFAADDQ